MISTDILCTFITACTFLNKAHNSGSLFQYPSKVNQVTHLTSHISFPSFKTEAVIVEQWLSGRALDLRSIGPWFESSVEALCCVLEQDRKLIMFPRQSAEQVQAFWLKKKTMYMPVILLRMTFVCFVALHPSQQLWSCRDGQFN